MLGPLISAGASLLGGFLNRASASDANAANAAQAAQNIALQREFAQNAIQWKVKDAAKAGVHPLYALGASTTSFSPVSVGATADTSMGSALHSMGQDISRAVAAPMGPKTRSAAVDGVVAGQQMQQNKLSLENMSLQNDVLRAKLAVMLQPGAPPGLDPFPVPEKSKIEERPPLSVFGKRWATNPNTSPMKAWEDQYGDEGPIAWGMPLVIGANDAVYNAQERIKQSSFARYMLEMQRAIQNRSPWR